MGNRTPQIEKGKKVMIKRFITMIAVALLVTACMPTASDFKTTKQQAEQGDATAQNNLGNMYYTGDGVEKNSIKAVYWYTKASQQDNPQAQAQLGYMYYTGDGVKQDYKQALYWLKKSAWHGNAKAQYSLGLMYEHGQGVDKHTGQARYWYTKSAEQGNAQATAKLEKLSVK